MIELILNLLVITVLPFVYIGMINRIKSLWAGRKGPSLMQPWFDFLKLLKKGEVISTVTSPIFKAAPSVSLAAVILAGMVVPIINHKSILGFEGDFIFFAYILAMGKFFSILSAMDTGSSFEGMGASREVTFSSLMEPAFLIIISALCVMTGFTRFESLSALLPADSEMATLTVGLSILVIFIMILVEGCRVPVDDPNTHLELTMIHEVMILDNSGPDLAFIQYGSALKMVIFSSLIPNLLLPRGLPLLFWFPLYLIIVFIIAAAIGLIESLMARLRLIHVPQFILMVSSVSFISLAALIIYTYTYGPGGPK
ncbi:MAG: respiratory chain complex I subunit 1 family protein [Candidatus Omnitrophota bacterium]